MKVFKIKMRYMNSMYMGSKSIKLNEETNQKDLNFIYDETNGSYQGIFEIPQPIKEKKKK